MPPPPFKVITFKGHSNKKFRYQRTFTKISVSPPSQVGLITWLIAFLQSLLDYFKNIHNPKQSDLVGLTIQHERLLNRPIYLALRKERDLTPGAILGITEQVLQSNDNFELPGKLFCEYTHVSIPQARGVEDNSRKLYFNSRPKKCVLPTCDGRLARAIILAESFLNETQLDFQNLASDTELQNIRAGHLEDSVRGLVDLKVYQTFLQDYCIVVFNDSRGYIKKVFGEDGENRKNIYLIELETDFYDVILNPASALGWKYFCNLCHVGFNTKGRHKCLKSDQQCPSCFKCVSIEGEIRKCEACKRHFQNELCYQRHLSEIVYSNSRTTCDIYKLCEICGQEYSLKHRTKHVCKRSRKDYPKKPRSSYSKKPDSCYPKKNPLKLS